MKSRLKTIVTNIRDSRRAKVIAIAAAVWIALLVGFVGASWMLAQTNKGPTPNSPQSAGQTKRKRKHIPKTASKTGSENASAPHPTTPCSVPAVASQERPASPQVSALPAHNEVGGDQTGNMSPLAPDHGQVQQYYRQPTSCPVAPYPTSTQAPAIVWVAVVVPPYNRSVQTRVAVQGTSVSVSVMAQNRSEPGFQPFRPPVRTGNQK